MIRRPASPTSAFEGWLLGAVLALVAAFVAWDALARGRHVLAVASTYGVTVDAPAITPASPTGYADGRRSLVLPAAGSDTAHWIMQTQAMLARGEWRVRWADYDNAPAGREVHWAAPFHWWLAGLAWLDHGISGRPLGQSVERAAVYSGPVMLALLLTTLTPLLWRRFSALAAGLVALGTVAVFPFYLDYGAGYADHHGFANICAMLTVLCLAAGTASGNPRGWFVASGIAGGIGLWISAATQTPVLVGVGLAVLVAAWFGRGAAPRLAWLRDPGLWRTWGWAGGGMSLAAWLLEYFPGHLGLRLEVNHPLYAAAWIGAAEVMRVAVLALRDGPAALARGDRVGLAWGFGLALLLPVIIACTSATTFVVADPFVWRLHALYISEFQGLGRILAKGINGMTAVLLLPFLLLLPPFWELVRRSTAPERRAELALVLVPAAFGWLMGWGQVRWLGLAFALSVPAVAVFFRAGEAGRTRQAFLAWLGAGLVLFAPGLTKAVNRTLRSAEFTSEEIQSLAERDVAHWLKLRGGAERVVVMTSPNPTSRLVYHGGINGVDSLYWENAPGLKHAAEFYAAPNAEAAREIAARLGVTHIVYFSWGAFEDVFVKLARGLPPGAPLPADSFAAQLLSSPVPPPWLQPVPLRFPDHPALRGEEVRVWEVVPAQSPASALARSANYFLELGRAEEAARLAPALARHDEDLNALVMLAGIASRARDADGFGLVLGRILERLDRAAALAPDEQLRLVVVLTVAQRLHLAQAQLRAAMAKLDERSLRHLTPGSLRDLLALSDGLQVPFPSPALQRLASQLTPPDTGK